MIIGRHELGPVSTSERVGRNSVTLGTPATKAVVFDLFGTLISWPEQAPYRRAMADRLAIDYDTFLSLWSKSWSARNVGETDAIGALRALCVERSLPADEERIAFAASAWTDFLRIILNPREWAVDAVDGLRSAGLRIGLMSDSPPEVPAIWPTTACAALVDEAVFSCAEKVLKPDPRLYAAIALRVGVEPSGCLYVGNGDSQELAGARQSGMRAVLFTGPGEKPGREAETWDGPRISDLRSIAGLT
jgi:putative hydrolase of the HAD superfamily